MPFSVAERAHEHGSQTTTAPQADTAALETAADMPTARAGRHRPSARLRPSQVPVRSPREVVRGPGQPLATPLRADMENRFGADFSTVRVHADDAARSSAADLGARAYTSGEHVVLGDGDADRPTLAHELAHILQQRQGPVAGTRHGDFSLSDAADVDERAAEATAHRALSGAAPDREAPGPTDGPHSGTPSVQRTVIVGKERYVDPRTENRKIEEDSKEYEEQHEKFDKLIKEVVKEAKSLKAADAKPQPGAAKPQESLAKAKKDAKAKKNAAQAKRAVVSEKRGITGSPEEKPEAKEGDKARLSNDIMVGIHARLRHYWQSADVIDGTSVSELTRKLALEVSSKHRLTPAERRAARGYAQERQKGLSNKTRGYKRRNKAIKNITGSSLANASDATRPAGKPKVYRDSSKVVHRIHQGSNRSFSGKFKDNYWGLLRKWSKDEGQPVRCGKCREPIDLYAKKKKKHDPTYRSIDHHVAYSSLKGGAPRLEVCDSWDHWEVTRQAAVDAISHDYLDDGSGLQVETGYWTEKKDNSTGKTSKKVPDKKIPVPRITRQSKTDADEDARVETNLRPMHQGCNSGKGGTTETDSIGPQLKGECPARKPGGGSCNLPRAAVDTKHLPPVVDEAPAKMSTDDDKKSTSADEMDVQSEGEQEEDQLDKDELDEDQLDEDELDKDELESESGSD